MKYLTTRRPPVFAGHLEILFVCQPTRFVVRHKALQIAWKNSFFFVLNFKHSTLKAILNDEKR
jgi:hypothetical protein